MTYKIYYKEHKMFDIDLYIACTEKGDFGERKYYTKVVSSIVAEGMGYYIIENIKTPEQLDEYLAWVNDIDDFSLTLFEGYPSMADNWENKPIGCHEADMRMCKVHRPVFEDMMRKFCIKYNLALITD